LRTYALDEGANDIFAAHYVWRTRRRVVPVFDPFSVIREETRPVGRVSCLESSFE
jgi:hypothetical protein